MTATHDLRESVDRDLGATPGWYADPEDESEIRWWDGRRWGPSSAEAQERGWWRASDGRYYPPKEWSGQPGLIAPRVESDGRPRSPTGPRPLYSRWWFWALVLVAGVPLVTVGMLVVTGVVLFDPVQLESEWVYEEDFSTGAGEFDVWDEPQGRAGVEDGQYVMTNRNSGAALQVWVYTPWTANRLQIEASMQLTDATDRDGFGLVLQRSDEAIYTVGVSPTTGTVISGPDLYCEEEPPVTAVRGGDVALRGEYANGAITLTASVDGRPVVTCVDETGLIDVGAFRAAGLWLFADSEPVTAVVDDAAVTAYKY